MNIEIVLNLIAEDQSLITYRPKLNQITGSVTATILFQQMLFYGKINKFKSFYKFKEACSHRLYKQGDSWCEILGFTKHEFDSAIDKIGIKFNKDNKDLPHDKFVEYYISQDRVTYYNLNLENIEKAFSELFLNPESGIGKPEFGFTCTPESGFSKSRNPDLYNTENYTENKNYDDDSKSESQPKESLFDDTTNSSSCFDDLKKYGITQSQIDAMIASLKIKEIDPKEFVTDKLNQFQWIEKNNPAKYQRYKNKAATLLKSIAEDWIDEDYTSSKNRPPSPKVEDIKYQKDYLKASRILDFYNAQIKSDFKVDDEFQNVISKCPLLSDEIEFVLTEYFERKKAFDIFELLKSPDLRKIYNDLKLEGLNTLKNKFAKETKIEFKSKVG